MSWVLKPVMLNGDSGMIRILSVLAVLLCGSLFAALLCAPAQAHEMRPAVVTVTFAETGRFDVAVQVNAEALLASIGPQHSDTDDAPQAQHYNRLRRLTPAQLGQAFADFGAVYAARMRFAFDGETVAVRYVGLEAPPVGDVRDARVSTIRLSGSTPAGAETFRWQYDAALGDAVLRVALAGVEQPRVSWLTRGAPSEPIPLQGQVRAQSTAEVVVDYLYLGFTHILPKGLDHILFVLGLVLLSRAWRPLLAQITAFTVAHTITLGMTLYGVIGLSPAIVEPLIALSIVYVAVENLFTRTLKPWRVLLVFGFDLLHGMGFTGVLQSLGLPPGNVPTALLSFNIGVELGQLAVVLLALLVVVWFKDRAVYRRYVVIPGSLSIAAVGAYWTVERLVF